MTASRQNLMIDIRLALLSLKRDPYISLNRLSVADLKAKLKDLRVSQREVGGILKQN